MKKTILSIVGARPQFIKAGPVSRALRKHFTEILVDSGQHYDYNMSARFFEELRIPEPDYHLNVGSGTHAVQTAQILTGVEEILLKARPDWVIVYGDTNTTLAGVLAAAKLSIPAIHIEAGLRSFNREMPEEINRVVADHLSSVLFAPTGVAVKNLATEGIMRQVYNVGDVMYDAVIDNMAIAVSKSNTLKIIGLETKRYYLATIHRAENTDDPELLKRILQALSSLKAAEVILPLHPRTRKSIMKFDLEDLLVRSGIRFIEPVGYFDMLLLEKNAAKIITDSGGVQKEAYILGVPCITLRGETEWVETVDSGWNILVSKEELEKLASLEKDFTPGGQQPAIFGDGDASGKICSILQTLSSQS